MIRRRSDAALRNDERLLDAAADELAAAGVDRVAMSAVARRAKLTTGALYSRYENGAELAAAVWTARVRDPHRALLDAAVRSLVDRDRGADLDRLHAELSSASEETLVALELIGTARRVDELEEVVFRDVRDWMREWEARGTDAGAVDPQRRARVAFTVAAVWGVLLHEIPRPGRRDWTYMTRSLRWAFGRDYTERGDAFVADTTGPVLADTGDPSQNALIDAVEAIVARVGFERASATRIARRADLTPGSIYTRYRTKDDLLRHAVEILLARRFSDDLEANSHTFTATDVGSATASVVGGYLGPERRGWRQFRIEAQLAAAHRPDLAEALLRIQEAAIREYLDRLGATTDEERAALDVIAAFAQVVPLGLAFADLVVPGIAETDWRRVLTPLLTPGP